MIRLFLAASAAVLAIVLATFWFVPAHGAECTTASWYGRESCISTPCRTRSGSIFTGNDMTAAMSSPRHLGEHWRVTAGGKSITVLVDDTGGFAKYGRGIDLSKAAFARLAPLQRGTLKVCLERVG